MSGDLIRIASGDDLASHPNLEEEIRRLAYELYEGRDREDGHDLDDWLRAEAEIIGTAVLKTTA